MAVLPVGQSIYRPKFNLSNTHTPKFQEDNDYRTSFHFQEEYILKFQEDNLYNIKLNQNENGYYSIKYHLIDHGKPEETVVIFDGGQNIHDVIDILFDGGWIKEEHGE